MSKPLWMWVFFIVVVVTLLLVDLGIFHKKEHAIKFKESVWMSAFYIFSAFLFGLWIWFQLGLVSFAEYLTGFLVEKSLSLDNIFVISLIFSTLSIPSKYQHRVLFWGILGVIILRAIMIGIGAELIHHFSWVLYLFSIFMVFIGIKMFFVKNKKMDINKNFLYIWMNKRLRIKKTIRSNHFFVRQIDPKTKKKALFITPLFVSLVLVEFIDLIFALDSVPAIFTITKDPYIVYTSNIFAILGLRALYSVLASVIDRFYYLHYALAMVLIFIGSKLFIAKALGLEKFPPLLSLFITGGLIAWGCLYKGKRGASGGKGRIP